MTATTKKYYYPGIDVIGKEAWEYIRMKPLRRKKKEFMRVGVARKSEGNVRTLTKARFPAPAETPICVRHNIPLTFSYGYYGKKAECSGCLRDGCPQGDHAKYGEPATLGADASRLPVKSAVDVKPCRECLYCQSKECHILWEGSPCMKCGKTLSGRRMK